MADGSRLATPEQAVELYGLVTEITKAKGRAFMDSPTLHWRGTTVKLPPSIKERAGSTDDDAEKFQMQTSLGIFVTAPEALALVRFIAPRGFSSGYESLEYRIIGEPNRSADIECRPFESLVPRIPKGDDLPTDPTTPVSVFDLDDEFSGHPEIALDILIANIQNRSMVAEAHQLELEARQRELGHFITTHIEASELIDLATELRTA